MNDKPFIRVVRRALGVLVGWAFVRKNRAVALLYHSIGCGEWDVSAQAFKRHMEWLKATTEVVSLEKLMDGSARGRKVCHIRRWVWLRLRSRVPRPVRA